MFNCDFCSTPTGPRVSPRMVTLEERDVTYQSAFDEDGVLKSAGAGREIVYEGKQCPTCSPTYVPRVEVVPNYTGERAFVGNTSKHTKGCKKVLADCEACQNIIKKIGGFSLPALSFALTEPQAQSGKLSLAEVVVENLIARSMDDSKRAKADYAAAYGVLKPYEARGGSL